MVVVVVVVVVVVSLADSPRTKMNRWALERPPATATTTTTPNTAAEKKLQALNQKAYDELIVRNMRTDEQTDEY